ncbi:MAG TPA: FAD-dependent monooxygenase [Gaiellaceae bacterium]|jgi:2-polyprenyl-6-methoxyphenol hydroxylase-like FAD-dependent oxidoreductase
MKEGEVAGAYEEFQVVVVGAGPGGLATAIELGSYGIATLVVDRRSATSRLPRATVASTGTMELLRRWGLEKAARERSLDVEWQAWECETLAAADQGRAIDVGLPTREQASLVSPSSPACLPQDDLEPLLERHLPSFPSLRLERGVELVALEQARDEPLLTLAGPGRLRRQVRARFVVGADGVRSTVRRQLGIPTEGSEGLEMRMSILFRAPLWNLAGAFRNVIYFLSGAQEGRSLIPAGKPDRWVLAMPLDDDDGRAPTPSQARQWIRQAAGDPGLPIELERSLPVVFGTGLAERFRAGNAFLIGDAAHRVTPRGGTGLNTAIRDGFDLGWKLAWVLRGWGGPRLLDSYERERRPVAEFNTERSSRSDGSILGNTLGLNADVGGRIAHLWVPRDGEVVSTLDLLGRGLTLFVGPDWGGAVSNHGADSPPLTLRRLDAFSARALGLTPTGALLARPDGHPAALWNDEHAVPERLVRAIRSASGRLRDAA